ncbi:ABC transporter substrate-binding protein [Allofournierella sp.]|uniref:ABC transporter substrate-binding protein n=1 Tax=Allofournierella sp. TaxID=1940256 RepID=UPI003AB7A225
MKRKLLSAMSLLLTALMLAACAGAPAVGPQPQSAVPGGASAQPADEKTVITFGIHVADIEQQEPQVYQILQGFMKANPDVMVDVIATSNADEQTTQMKLAAEAGNLPDVFWNNPAPSEEMFEAGYLMDLSEFLDYDKKVNAAIGDKLHALSDNGPILGLPYQKLVTGFWINKDVFVENGLQPPTNGTTFEEFMAMVETLNSKGVTTISNGAKTPYSVWAFLSAWVRYGFFDHVEKINAGKETWTNEDFVHYFEMIDKLRVAGAFPANITTQDYFQGKDAFFNGKAAMLDSGQWDSAEINAHLGEAGGFWWGPVFEDGAGPQQMGMGAFTNNIRVSAGVGEDENKKNAVFRFLSYWLSEEADAIRVSYGTNPLVTNPDVEVENAAYRAMLAALSEEGWEFSPRQPDLVVSSAVQNAMYDAIYGVMSGIYTPQQACEAIQAVQERE